LLSVKFWVAASQLNYFFGAFYVRLSARSREEMSMKGFTPGLFDRLLGTPVRGVTGASGATVSRISAEDLKDAVARDLEALLNTRAVIDEELLDDYPECSSSILGYGLNDFADRSLSSPADRAHICTRLEEVIARHEPRLRNVKASIEMREGAVNRLNFSITALLVASSSQEPVNFDAVLQRSTLQYSISKAGRGA
jgi:type VI secretion system protein ImpF